MERCVVLSILSLMNILNFIHRCLPSAIKVLIQDDLHLSDFQTGFIFTIFIICYMFVSPLVGSFSDMNYIKRKYLLFIGILSCSVATGTMAICPNFYTLLIPRLLFGIGESLYMTVSLPFLCDFFRPSQRNMAVIVYNIAVTIGCALGYSVSGVLGQYIGWRLTCVSLSCLGILSVLILLIREPEVGESDSGRAELPSPLSILYEPIGEETQRCPRGLSPSSWLNRYYFIAVCGLTGVSFGMGGFSDWSTAYFHRYYNMSIETASLLNGGLILCGELVGYFVGGVVTEAIVKYTSTNVTRTYFMVSGISMGLSAIFFGIALFAFQSNLYVVFTMFEIATFFGCWYNSLISVIIQNSTAPRYRARASGLSILLIHLLGDAISPSIIGMISDQTDGNLRCSVILIPISLVCASFIWVGGGSLPRGSYSPPPHISIAPQKI